MNVDYPVTEESIRRAKEDANRERAELNDRLRPQGLWIDERGELRRLN